MEKKQTDSSEKENILATVKNVTLKVLLGIKGPIIVDFHEKEESFPRG